VTAPSPVQLATSIPSHAVTVGGKPLDSSIQVVSLDVWTGVNKIPKARLVISDGSAAAESFAISETAALVPGVRLSIALGYDSDRTEVFSGVVHRQGLDIVTNGPSRLVVEATSGAIKMTLARNNAIFPQMSDSAVCAKLIGGAGLTPDVTETSTEHPAIVQYYASDWDLLVMRAELSGMVVTISDPTVTVAPPDTAATPVLSLTYGDSILSFRGNMDATSQLPSSSIQSFAWDPGSQALLQSASASADVTTPGNIDSEALAAVFGVSAYTQQTAGALADGDLTGWSSAELMKSRLAKIRGEVGFQGSALAVPGCMVTLAGLGARFNGNAYVSAVHHRLTEGFWRTDVEIGLSPAWFSATTPDIAAPGASGQLPPVNNVQPAIVSKIDEDPDGEFRVFVTFPLLQAAEEQGVWARFGSFYASNGIGSNFYPEIGDEVVVAFLGGDPRYPVILGSLYSKAKPPPYPPVAQGEAAPNNVKSFMTKSKLHIDFVEDLPQLLIKTPGNQSVDLNDKEKTLTLTDASGNTVTMSKDGIALNSASDISITAKGSITISATRDVTVSAKQSLAMSATSSAQLTCDGSVQIKGVTVALNP
jgi:Rhs element Vgr protein